MAMGKILRSSEGISSYFSVQLFVNYNCISFIHSFVAHEIYFIYYYVLLQTYFCLYCTRRYIVLVFYDISYFYFRPI